MKKVISLALATAVCVSVVACAQPGSNTTAATLGTLGPISTSSKNTTAATTGATAIFGPGMTVPTVDANEADNVHIDINGYATLVYNPLCCKVAYKIENGLGAKKMVTVSISVNEGYVFDGWSRKYFDGKYGDNQKKVYISGAIANGGKVDSAEMTYTYELTKSAESTIYANCSAVVKYNPNGGTVASGDDIYTQKFSMMGYKCPNTLPEKNYFKNPGYTLLEYNTKADGSGVSVSPGSKIAMNLLENGTLYCIWEKQNAESDFIAIGTDGGVSITTYMGTSDNVVIPDTIGGKSVVKIASGAFQGKPIKRVVLSKNIKTVDENAFKNCSNLESLVMFDNVTSITDKSFTGAPLKNLQINAVLDMDTVYTSSAAPKMDRLIWAKANGKKVIAICGGSGSLFGWDSVAIEEAFNDEYVVVNLGTNANVTATLYFEALNALLDSGDIVLWSPEPGEWTYGSTAMGNSNSWFSSANTRSWEVNAAHYDAFKYADISKYSLVFDAYAKYAATHSQKQTSFDSFSDDMNACGDADALNNEPANGGGYTYEGEYDSSNRKSLWESEKLDYMEELIASLTEKEVKVFYTYAAMDENGKESIDYDYMSNTFEKLIEERFKGIEIITDIKDCFVPSTQMRDSKWHLTREGAKTRTAVVIEDLKSALGK